ncbi:IS5 family transposase [Zymomonas mobilis]|uniref:IS5 family transposase n=1 Tax=Zymomonas mobilis TaxID=542 RepID=UPI0039E90896
MDQTGYVGWDALLQTLVELGLTDDWQHMLDSTVVRAHSQATGAKEGLMRKLLVDRAAVLRAKSTPDATIQRRPPGFVLIGGQASDYKAVNALMALPAPNPRAMLADRGYDSDSFRQDLMIHGILLVIPSRKGRSPPQKTDWRRYRERNRIAWMFNHLKQMRRIATRYNKTALSFMSFLNIAAARLWIRSLVNGNQPNLL